MMAIGLANLPIAVTQLILFKLHNLMFLNFEDTEELLSLKNVNNTCIFRNDEPNVVSFYNDQKVTSDIVEYPKDTILVSRCVDIGKFSMTGTPCLWILNKIRS